MIRTLYIFFLAGTAAAQTPADNGPALQGSVESISAESWAVEGFSSSFELTASGLAGEIRIARISLTESGQVFDDIQVHCSAIRFTTRTVECGGAAFDATVPTLGRQTASGHFSYDHVSASATIQLSQVAIAGGEMQFDIAAASNGITAHFNGSNLQLDELAGIAAQINDTFSDYFATGSADVTGTLEAPLNGPLHIRVTSTLANVAMGNNAGTIATDSITADLDLDMLLRDAATTFSMTFDSNQGEAYVEPVYANFSEHRFRLQADNVTTSDFAKFDVPSFHLQQEQLLDTSGSITLAFPEEDGAPLGITADIEIRNSSLSNLYTSLIRIPLAGTVLGSLETDGRLSGSVRILDNAPQSATLQFEDVILDDQRGRFAVYGLQGNINWRADETDVPAPSHIRWDSGTVYDVVIGSSQMHAQLGDNDIEILEPLRFPTMGGALHINHLALQNFGSDDATGALDAELEPIQLGQLTGAFGWPAFSGTLSGQLPLLQLAENTITVGGALSAQAFDGTMEMSNLRIEQPFGRVPRMQGDLIFRNLDLRRVTEAFSFGLIQGRLSGDVAGLRMQNWRPVAMDMHFYTPSDDKSQHRISQRAVENLASVGGGGAGAVLSTGFLQFFEVFAYDRIGLRCVLANGACAMSGAGTARSDSGVPGYYIVKGRGLPRIDVVGFRDTVSWPGLVQQLAAIARSGSPTVN